jgi:hypothetical protein
MKENTAFPHMETIYILVHIQYSIEEGAGLIINFVRYKLCNYKLCYV